MESRMVKRIFRWVWPVVVPALWGCVNDGGWDPGEPQPGAENFVSSDPTRQGTAGAGGPSDGDYGADASAPGAREDDAGEAGRAIEEADIIKLQGDTLYALSAYRGLVVVDVSNPDDLRILGRHAMYGTPFEMYVRGGMAYVMYSSFWAYIWSDSGRGYEWQNTSRIVVLDVADPASIVEMGNFDLAGEISDSRIVGDVLYAVSYENGYCWRCDGGQRTTVTSLAVGDPSAIRVVDRLAYADEGYGWQRRSVTVTPERMYVSGVNWTGDWRTSNSTIQVVDISDPTGILREGARVPVSGQIESRWQMDEFDDVLRVVSQPGWGANDTPVVETFAVVSAAEILPLGRMAMRLPRPERLMSTRFDGNKAYAVTFQRTDPLFTIDLSDPANPVQRGELEIPGWLYYMEPRGDRLFAIGFEQTGTSSLAVSLFDVSDLDTPTMLSRVNFGPNWGGMPEDQDRVHKAFRILPDLGMVLMPFSGWSHDEDGWYGAYHSGVQIIDFTRDGLVKRGVLPHKGQARRAFVHRERLFAVSDERIESYDFADRDRPVLADELKFARNVYRVAAVGDHIVQLSSDWWTREARLDVVPLARPDDMIPVGSIDLGALKPELARPYYYWYNGFDYWSSRLFADGNFVYLVWGEGYYYCWDDTSCANEPKTGVAVFDLSDPAAPRLAGHARFPFRYPYYEGYWYTGTVEAGETIARVGSALVFRIPPDYSWYYDYGPEGRPRGARTLEVIDLANPENPRHSATVRLPGDFGMGTMHVQGSLVVTSHYEPEPDADGFVRFYLDRIDLSDPWRPRQLPEINIPGSPASVDLDASRLVTIDYRWTSRRAVSWEECYREAGWYDYYSRYFEYDDRTYTGGTCYTLNRALNVLALSDRGATLLDRLRLTGRSMTDVRVSGDRIYIGTGSTYYWYYDEGAGHDPRPELITITGVRNGRLVQRSAVRMSNPGSRLIAALGARAITQSSSPPEIAVYDATRPESTELANRTLLTGYGYEVQIVGDDALCANGSAGVQVVPLR